MILSVRHVSKVYHLEGGDLEILKDINLDINKGDFVSITGPSGSGKSTLMHIIGLLDNPSSGQVILEGKDAAKMSESELAKMRNQHIGFVFQQYNLLSRTSALENVELPMYYGGVSANERKTRATKLLELVGLSNRLDHKPNQLSGGQQQRVAIARALSMNPLILLADEPTGNLDSQTGQDIIKLFHDLNDKGNTIVLVTHDLQVAKHAKKIIKIKDGRIID
jgi:putative ABC transport system ATP-binding protein